MHTRRSKSIDLASFDPELEQTLRKLRRKIKQQRATVSLPPSSPPHLSSEEEEEPPEDMADNRTLRELATPNTDQQPLCITYPNAEGGFELKSGMIHYLPKFHGFSTALTRAKRGNERVDYIPGVSSTRLVDLPHFMDGSFPNILRHIHEDFSWVPRAQYLLFPSIYELETQVLDVLRAKFSLPVYTIGPSIPYFNSNNDPSDSGVFNYLKWLDSKPSSSVLYISMGSFLSVSSAQMDEIAAGLHESGVRFIWVARGETGRLKEVCGDMGLVVPWCDQLRVLCHDNFPEQ
ncbi:PREDICTED: UDP-glycosyltransferase 87A2-like, partial [Prunus mume]|uniref:UDP-glycosyltransferase 87A2-like n=1 Tax=Prunus mume TaxID=102107 RepID=A0ABM0PW86_PRUMU